MGVRSKMRSLLVLSLLVTLAVAQRPGGGGGLVADPALALMGGDQRALMAQDPSAHQGASAVLLLATTAPPPFAQTGVLHRSQRSRDPALMEVPRAVVEPAQFVRMDLL